MRSTKKIRLTLKNIVLSFIFLFFSLNYAVAQSHTILVLDTSRSVSDEKYFTTVKEIVKNIVASLSKQDKISLFTFDSKLTQILFKEPATSQNLTITINELKPRGSWTYTALMLKQIVNFLQVQNDEVINLFIFSDGLDNPPPSESTVFTDYQGSNSKVFYVYHKEDQTQKNLIRTAFPNVILQKISQDEGDTQEVNSAILKYLLPYTSIELQGGLNGLLPTDVESVIVLNVIANKVVAGKEGILNVKSNYDLFNKSPNRQTRFVIQEGANNFRLPYSIKNSFQGKAANIEFQFALAEEPTKYLNEKNIKIKIAELAFLEKLYKLPLYSIPFLFVVFMLFYIFYRIIHYQLFTPIIEMSYKLQNHSKNLLDKDLGINTVNMGIVDNGKYVISSRPDAFLVLPELSNYTELTLIKKGKKFKSKLLIHKSSIRSILALDGGRVKKARIRNGSVFCLDNYIFSFKTNLD